MPKINVYLPDDLAAAVKEAGVPVSSVCQQALAEAVLAATGGTAPSGGLEMIETASWNRFTARARSAVDRALRNKPATTVELLSALVEEGENLALTVLAALDVEPPDVVAEARGHGNGTDLRGALDRAVSEAVRLQHNFVGCEHLLLGLAAGPDDDGVAVALRAMSADLARLRTAVSAAVAGVVFSRTQQATAGLSAPVRAILEDIRSRLTRLERGTAT
ncbi:Clp protease N-terminal domain-containing protein [Pseudonocardia alaniniphila]|uniref:ATP-dependent Clp protease ATP-binding subunit n=1 Tax=Pseudonocardia alaniniphila TaxID=75291 RepID=A0ABS9TSZ5_9PSEU|nr:Clp protease N-terminal domain-containing protein [Pseudonocardia alaniniphila]MCH6171674.1 ATP-dependent Clp protease ATP-binding subunit [Pseudonocardia alaniniphila]